MKLESKLWTEDDVWYLSGWIWKVSRLYGNNNNKWSKGHLVYDLYNKAVCGVYLDTESLCLSKKERKCSKCLKTKIYTLLKTPKEKRDSLYWKEFYFYQSNYFVNAVMI